MVINVLAFCGCVDVHWHLGFLWLGWCFGFLWLTSPCPCSLPLSSLLLLHCSVMSCILLYQTTCIFVNAALYIKPLDLHPVGTSLPRGRMTTVSKAWMPWSVLWMVMTTTTSNNQRSCSMVSKISNNNQPQSKKSKLDLPRANNYIGAGAAKRHALRMNDLDRLARCGGRRFWRQLEG